jgi:putative membrane protein
MSGQWGGGGWGMGPGMMGGYGYGMGWFGMILMMVFWVAVIVGIVVLIRWLIVTSRSAPEGRKEDSALELLKKRYVRGEISKEEYEEKKKDIAS